jgi:ribonucleotide reductase alpha subunit
MNRRTLGIGVINYAYYLAKNGVRYSDGSALGLTHRTFEAIQFYLLKASVKLAQEYGACPKFGETTYSQGCCPLTLTKKIWMHLHRAFAFGLGRLARRHRETRLAQFHPDRLDAV